MFVKVEKGTIYLSSAESRLADLIDTDTPDWMANTELLEEWTLAARTELPPSLFLLIGPLQRIDLGIKMVEKAWTMQFHPYTPSKAPPQKLLLVYLATLQSSLQREKKPNPPERLDEMLKEMSKFQALFFAEHGRHLIFDTQEGAHGTSVPIASDVRLWIKEEGGLRIFVESQNGESWVRSGGTTTRHKEP